jgi:lipoprotein NlpI
MRHIAWVLLLAALARPADLGAQSVDSPAAASHRASLAARLRSTTQAIEADPQDKDAWSTRAGLHAQAGDHLLAIADYDALLKLDPTRAETYDSRGSQHFMLGHIQASIDDFDRSIKLNPRQEPWHWKRGIAYYYAERWDEGRRQFEGYQTVDDNDVENAVWRYLCMARGMGPRAARDAMLKIRRDTRVPMAEVHALYSGQARPEDVLAAARAGSPSPEALNTRLFYAHLYLGLYYEANGDASRAREHNTTAAEKHKIGHYMWNVADVHARLRKSPAPKQP